MIPKQKNVVCKLSIRRLERLFGRLPTIEKLLVKFQKVEKEPRLDPTKGLTLARLFQIYNYLYVVCLNYSFDQTPTYIE